MITPRHAFSLTRRAVLMRLGVGGVGGALAAVPPLASGRHVSAQDATLATMATHPFVGAWRFANDPADPANVSLYACHADGICVQPTGDIGTAIWVWRATGDRTADATGIALDTDPDRNKSAPGTVMGWMSIEVDATGNALTAESLIRVLDPSETVVFEFEASGMATRMMVEPMPPLGTPAAGTSAS